MYKLLHKSSGLRVWGTEEERVVWKKVRNEPWPRNNYDLEERTMSDFVVLKGKHRANIIAKTQRARLYLHDVYQGVNLLADGSSYINRDVAFAEELVKQLEMEGYLVEVK